MIFNCGPQIQWSQVQTSLIFLEMPPDETHGRLSVRGTGKLRADEAKISLECCRQVIKVQGFSRTVGKVAAHGGMNWTVNSSKSQADKSLLKATATF